MFPLVKTNSLLLLLQGVVDYKVPKFDIGRPEEAVLLEVDTSPGLDTARSQAAYLIVAGQYRSQKTAHNFIELLSQISLFLLSCFP